MLAVGCGLSSVGCGAGCVFFGDLFPGGVGGHVQCFDDALAEVVDRVGGHVLVWVCELSGEAFEVVEFFAGVVVFAAVLVLL